MHEERKQIFNYMQKEKGIKILIITQKVDIADQILGFFHRWIEEFSKHVEQVTVIALGVGEYQLPANVRVFSLGKERGVSRIGYIFNFYRLIWRERKNYDVVFVHMNPEYVVLGGICWRLWSKRVALWYTHKNVDLKLRIVEKLANIIFTASRESFRLVSDKIKIMGHGIDIEIFNPSLKKESEFFRIITVGRISPVKDYETLIKAVEILMREKVSVVVDIIGGPVTIEDEHYLKNLYMLVQEKKLDEIIQFVGSVTNKELPEHLRQADIFVNMSRTGSLDKAVLEAMACGSITVTSNEAFKEVFGKDAKMLMFQSGDTVSLAEKIKILSSLGQKERNEITKRLRNVIVEKHNIESLIPRILSSYEASR